MVRLRVLGAAALAAADRRQLGSKNGTQLGSAGVSEVLSAEQGVDEMNELEQMDLLTSDG